jgi:hypothetical protein
MLAKLAFKLGIAAVIGGREPSARAAIGMGAWGQD